MMDMRTPTPEEARIYHIHGESVLGRRVLGVSEQGRDELVVVKNSWGWYVEILTDNVQIRSAWVAHYGQRITRMTPVIQTLDACVTEEDVSRELLRHGFEKRAL